ncbi:chemotaxis protein CheD [Methanocella sp. CWC-04]|uniref:Probable chemoreceptor glutamine deamidase CheD n=1 Tax=Methanooceanicella nereidis TaxID=2052831 RepID=A0AAP2W4E2_9EURY|nr:chemotaxis protein CheD [Methanocella sp. CWC-04]MCD1294165.1 chemotaxis protein CheD [Methanocella sp. CWC-04]
MADEVFEVGMGEIVVTHNPATLSIIGLGSCVGVALYNPKAKMGGLAHVMLPDSKRSRPGANLKKFADTGIAIMMEELKKKGVDHLWTTAKLVGGASMFQSADKSVFNIGSDNVTMCREILKGQRIKIVSEDVLGNKGRTMKFDLVTGKVQVRYVDGLVREI